MINCAQETRCGAGVVEFKTINKSLRSIQGQSRSGPGQQGTRRESAPASDRRHILSDGWVIIAAKDPKRTSALWHPRHAHAASDAHAAREKGWIAAGSE